MDAQAHDLGISEAIELGAADAEFYCRYFFPRAFRQKTPGFHKEIWTDLDDPTARYVSCKVFRGGAKTTVLRAFTSRRIAYDISRTILFVSEAQNHAIRSIEWIKRAVKYNPSWAKSFGLRIGDKDSAEEVEIVNEITGSKVRLIALGITGQTRGVNVEDFRPDLIVVDDPCDEENTATPEQRKKISDLFFGALAKSLAPSSEVENAKMVLLQTPLHREDLVESCGRDPQWRSHSYGCFDDEGRSRWQARWTTEELLAEKAAHVARNQLSLWLREMECKIVSEETSYFRPHWLQHWDVQPEEGITVISIDPVPPPSENEIAKGLRDKDKEVIQAWRQVRTKRYLLESVAKKGHNPDWTIAELFRMVRKYQPIRVGVESIAYQRVLAWLIRQAMQNQHYYFAVEEVVDKRKKSQRIQQAYSGHASNGLVYVHPSQTEFIEQFNEYPDVSHDDELDCGAIAFKMLDELNVVADAEFEVITEGEDELDLLEFGGAP